MGHIHSDSQYDYTASAIIVNKNKVALLFHHKHSLWLPPAGHIELDETPIEALYREMEEETGLTKEHLTLVPTFRDNEAFERDSTNQFHPIPMDMDIYTVNEAGHRHIDLMHVLLSDTDKLVKEKDGAEKLEWFTLDEVKQLSPMPKKIISLAAYGLKVAKEFTL